ncbi:polyketide synthase dehydratase domain-containing protein, partial [Streptomyces tauricus]|uniref:polyketide synthase dehydratase domain-containing protein n=1 Tax=Streptomyces tauricus TaxID=68274 RepID=UPI0033BD488E
DYASHSAQVDGLTERILADLGPVRAGRAEVPFFSTVTGGWLGDEVPDAAYWVRNLRRPVRFQEAVSELTADGFRRFVEVSPHPVLTTGVQATAEDRDVDVAVVGTLRRDEGGRARLLRSVAEVFVTGAPVRWARPDDGVPVQRAELPTYAFQRKRYWAAGSAVAVRRLPAGQDGMDATGHPLLGTGVPMPGTGGFLFTGSLSLTDQPWLRDHVVQGSVVVPGTALLDMVLRAAETVGCGRVDELTLEEPLVLTETEPTHVQVLVGKADQDGGREAHVHARPQGAPSDGWVRHARAALTGGDPHATVTAPDAWPPAGGEPVDIEGLYERLGGQGLAYGPAFRGLTNVWRGSDGEVLAEVTLPEADPAGFGIHPALLDAALHAWLACEDDTRDTDDGVRLPFLWAGVTLHATGATGLRVRLVPSAGGALSVRVTDTGGRPVLSADALVTRPLSEASFPAPAGSGAAPYRVAWSAVQTPAGTDGAPSVAVLGQPLAGLPESSKPLQSSGSPYAGCADLDALRGQLSSQGLTAPGHVLVDVADCMPAGAGDDVAASAGRTAAHALGLVQQWLADERFDASRLVFVTRGAVQAERGEKVDGLAAATVWGLVRSAQTEHPDRFVLLDLLDELGARGQEPRSTMPDMVLRALSTGEPQLAVRGEDILVPRLVRDEPAPAPVSVRREQRRLTHAGNGTLEGIAWSRVPDDENDDTCRADRALGAREVRVELRAVGLNFRDVLITLGMYPDAENAPMGSEGAGVVTEVGSAVTGVAVGDRVMGIWQGGFRSTVVVDERVVVGVPVGWSFVEAASVPVAFVTAY